MKKPSEEWKDYLHEMKNLDKAAADSFKLYKNKYAKEDKEFPRKEELDDVFFTAGKIYSFVYTTQAKPNKDRPVIDRRPILLSLGQMINQSNSKVYEVGIDLMLVPPKVRIFLLDQVYKFFYKDINNNQKNINEGRKGKTKLRLDYNTSKKVFDKLGWQMAFSAFSKESVAIPAVYDYEDWVKTIPLYTNGLIGKTIGELYDYYTKKMTSTIEVDLISKLK